MNILTFGNQQYDEFSAFIAIAQTKSFSAAAQKLQRHPSIMSKRIASLEDRLGVRLIERSTRNVKLTEAGEHFYEKLIAAAKILEDAEQEAGHLSKNIAGILRISVPGALGRLWLCSIITEFARAHPRLTVHTEYSDKYVDVISEGYDACIRVGKLEDSRLVANRLCDHSRILCASPEYIDRFSSPGHPRDLLTHNCLGHTGLRTYPEWNLYRNEEKITVIARGNFLSNDGEALLNAARQGIGILGSSNWLVARDIAAGTLIPILPGWTFDRESAIYMIRPSVKFTPSKSVAFKSWMERALSNGAPWEKLGITNSSVPTRK